jgi:hypothetical protein
MLDRQRRARQVDGDRLGMPKHTSEPLESGVWCMPCNFPFTYDRLASIVCSDQGGSSDLTYFTGMHIGS